MLLSRNDDLAVRHRRMAEKTALTFKNFVLIYRAFDPDQPRDEEGWWVESGDVETTGSIPILWNRTTGNLEIDSITEKLAQKLH